MWLNYITLRSKFFNHDIIVVVWIYLMFLENIFLTRSNAYSPLPNCRGRGRGSGQTPFFEKNILDSIYYNRPKLRNWLKVPIPPNYYNPPYNCNPPTIPNFGPETLFIGAWKRDTKIVIQELNEKKTLHYFSDIKNSSSQTRLP